MEGFIIKSVNISKEKGTVKSPVEEIEVNELGVVGDAHAGSWHRQVSLLGMESIRKASEQVGYEIKMGNFAENITTEGMLLYHTRPLDRFVGNQMILEVTQIGKKCHHGCEIMKVTGDCVMPKEGIFCRVIRGGNLAAGASFKYQPKIFRIKILTLSDRAFRGVYEDKSGPYTEKLLTEFFKKDHRKYEFSTSILPDDKEKLKAFFQSPELGKYDLVFTTGGTGIGPRDITPDVVRPFLEKEITGIMELIRVKYGMIKHNALISRGVAGTMGKTMIFTLPGSLKAVNEYLSEITGILNHSFRMIHGIDAH